jgi:hypothetical protein
MLANAGTDVAGCNCAGSLGLSAWRGGKNLNLLAEGVVS